MQELTADSFAGVDIALFSAGGAISHDFAPVAVRAGAVVVDNSRASEDPRPLASLWQAWIPACAGMTKQLDIPHGHRRAAGRHTAGGRPRARHSIRYSP